MRLQLLELFVKKLLREAKKVVLTYFFSRTSEKAHGCHYRPFSHYGDLAGWQNSPTRTPNWKRG